MTGVLGAQQSGCQKYKLWGFSADSRCPKAIVFQVERAYICKFLLRLFSQKKTLHFTYQYQHIHNHGVVVAAARHSGQ